MSISTIPSCPAGSRWFSCSYGSLFTGCCAQGDACGSGGCNKLNIRSPSLTPSLLQYPNQSCPPGSKLYASITSRFIGCCASNPLTFACPQSDLVRGIYTSVESVEYIINDDGNVVDSKNVKAQQQVGPSQASKAVTTASSLPSASEKPSDTSPDTLLSISQDTATAARSVPSQNNEGPAYPTGSAHQPGLSVLASDAATGVPSPAFTGASNPSAVAPALFPNTIPWQGAAPRGNPSSGDITDSVSLTQPSATILPSEVTAPSATPTATTSSILPDIPDLPRNTVLGLAVGIPLALLLLLTLASLLARRHAALSRERHSLTRPTGEAFLDAPAAFKIKGKVAPGNSVAYEPPSTFSDSSFFRAGLQTPPPVYARQNGGYSTFYRYSIDTRSTSSRYSHYSELEYRTAHSSFSSLQHTPEQQPSPIRTTMAREDVEMFLRQINSVHSPAAAAPVREDVGWPLKSEKPDTFMGFF